MSWCIPYKQQFLATKYVTLKDAINYSNIQPIDDRLQYLIKGESSIKEFYKPSGDKFIDSLIESQIEQLVFYIQFKNIPYEQWESMLPVNFLIGVS